MPRRPTPKTLKSLHATLQKLEQTDNPADAPESISELKRVLLSRIADLELSKILEIADAETDNAPAPEPADLVPPPSTIKHDQLDTAIEATELDKLD